MDLLFVPSSRKARFAVTVTVCALSNVPYVSGMYAARWSLSTPGARGSTREEPVRDNTVVWNETFRVDRVTFVVGKKEDKTLRPLHLSLLVRQINNNSKHDENLGSAQINLADLAQTLIVSSDNPGGDGETPSITSSVNGDDAISLAGSMTSKVSAASPRRLRDNFFHRSRGRSATGSSRNSDSMVSTAASPNRTPLVFRSGSFTQRVLLQDARTNASLKIQVDFEPLGKTSAETPPNRRDSMASLDSGSIHSLAQSQILPLDQQLPQQQQDYSYQESLLLADRPVKNTEADVTSVANVPAFVAQAVASQPETYLSSVSIADAFGAAKGGSETINHSHGAFNSHSNKNRGVSTTRSSLYEASPERKRHSFADVIDNARKEFEGYIPVMSISRDGKRGTSAHELRTSCTFVDPNGRLAVQPLPDDIESPTVDTITARLSLSDRQAIMTTESRRGSLSTDLNISRQLDSLDIDARPIVDDSRLKAIGILPNFTEGAGAGSMQDNISSARESLTSSRRRESIRRDDMVRLSEVCSRRRSAGIDSVNRAQNTKTGTESEDPDYNVIDKRLSLLGASSITGRSSVGFDRQTLDSGRAADRMMAKSGSTNSLRPGHSVTFHESSVVSSIKRDDNRAKIDSISAKMAPGLSTGEGRGFESMYDPFSSNVATFKQFIDDIMQDESITYLSPDRLTQISPDVAFVDAEIAKLEQLSGQKNKLLVQRFFEQAALDMAEDASAKAH